ncbi:MAG: transcription elongation factor GreA [Dehalococcoidia bacterium]|nr:transcription elongation factor GreA [Dehalococcoidia bacterium]
MAERITATEALEHFQTSLDGEPAKAAEDVPAVERFVAWIGADRDLEGLTLDEVVRYVTTETDETPKALEPLRAFLAYTGRLSFTDAGLVSAFVPAVPLYDSPSLRRARLNAGADLGDTAYSVTLDGLLLLERQLEAEKGKRPYIADKLREAMADKDFRENAPLDAARDEQGHLEARIRDLESRLRHAVIIDENAKHGRANVGSLVRLLNTATKKEQSFTLVSPNEVDPSKGKISIASPMGVAVINHATGDEVTVNAPSGPIRFKLLDVQG